MTDRSSLAPVAIARAESYEPTAVREALQELFHQLGYDQDNPFSGLVRPGDSVFIKPNWVAHQYRKSCPVQDSVYSSITHPVVITVVAEFVARALHGRGEILIGDNPSIDADFGQLIDLARRDGLKTEFDVPCHVVDLRPLRCVDLKDYGIKSRMSCQTGDPKGAVTVNLGAQSLLSGLSPGQFRGVFTDRTETMARHSGSRQEYTFSRSIFEADVYISVPKLKTHHKVGTTLNLKGLVGTVADKNLLVHWRTGFPGMGGDEYPSLIAWLAGMFQKVKKRGAWPGNDTIWRMVIDLYRAFATNTVRRHFSVVDGITAGQGDGPFCPRSKHAQVLLAGEDHFAVDCVASRLMGFDIQKIQYLRFLLEERGLKPQDIRVCSKTYPTEGFFDLKKAHLAFDPPSLWKILVPSDVAARGLASEK